MFLQVQHIVKSYDKVVVAQNLNFDLEQYKTLSVLGQSGCGKTTMLKIIAGLELPDSGEIKLNSTKITKTKPEHRNIVYLYQEDLLFPHLDVFENIAFALRIRKIPKPEITERVNRMIIDLELNGQASKMPTQLSGGQRQRVSFGRAIISNPKILLLDEPFGSLDAGTRKRMQALFKKLTSRYKITSLFVTHDLKEALLMGDEIGYMEHGSLRVYKEKQAFIDDPHTGVQEEIDYWKKLSSP